MNISRTAAEVIRTQSGLNDTGVMDLVTKTGLRHPRVRRVWVGDDTKISDVEKTLNSLGFKLEVAPL